MIYNFDKIWNLQIRSNLDKRSGMSVLSSLFSVFYRYICSLKGWIFPKFKDISGEIVLITGGGRGIGRQLALDIAQYRPQHIVIWGRTEECLQTTKDDIKTLGVQASYYLCDVSSREQIYNTARQVYKEVGAVTMLINNAGVVSGKTLLNLQESSIIHTLRVNSLAQIWTIKAFLPDMIANNHGHIVCMSSLLGLMGLKGTSDYTASKFSTTGLMETLMHELEVYPGIKTTIIHPYQVDNNMFAGVKIRFPKLFPPLQEKYVSEQSIKAILSNRRQIVMPSYFYFVLFLKSFLPVASLLPSLQFMGLDKAMDSFEKSTQNASTSASI